MVVKEGRLAVLSVRTSPFFIDRSSSLAFPTLSVQGLQTVQSKQSRKLPFSSSESDVRKRILGQGSQLSVVFAIEIEHHEQFVKPVTGGANALVFVL